MAHCSSQSTKVLDPLTPLARRGLTIDGRAILVNFVRRNIIYHFNFKATPTCLAFSPTGRFFAIGLGKQLQIWRTPGFDEAREREFAPFVKYRSYHGHYKDIT